MMRLVLISLLLYSCGQKYSCPADDMTTNPFETSQGFMVYPGDNDTSPEQVETAIILVADMLIKMRPEVYSWENITDSYLHFRYTIVVEDDGFPCEGSSSGLCRGANTNVSSIRYTWSPCIGDTSLAHELIHMYGALSGDIDINHTDPQLFDDAGGPTSVESQAKEELRSMYCVC